MRLIAPIIAALVLAPTAGAWTTISTTPLQNIDRPSLVRTTAGAELAVWDDNQSGLWLWSSTGGTRQIATVPFVNQPQIVQQPSGPLQIYVGSGAGIERLQSTDGGTTWTGPYAIVSPSTTGPVVSATVRPDGTPMFTQDSTFGVYVFQGLNGDTVHNVFTACCGYAESLAVDTSNLAQIAFWSNATAYPNVFVYEKLDATGAQDGQGHGFGQPATAARDDSVPLAADGVGNTFMCWAPGSPTASALDVTAFQGGNVGWTTTVSNGPFAGGDPHMGLSVDPANRVWAVWTQGGVVRARRSRSAARHFGAATVAGLGGATAYQLAALALPNGSADAFVNDGSKLLHQTFLPGLTVTATRTKATVLDDGFGVAATLKGGGRTFHANGAGVAKLTGVRRGTRLTVTAPGYAAASVRVP